MAATWSTVVATTPEPVKKIVAKISDSFDVIAITSFAMMCLRFLGNRQQPPAPN
eukprot:m.177705 g.177705  ORF g.177705 m.177705 type:complete len:54 (-) comp15352_c0_seq2:21-182(-)